MNILTQYTEQVPDSVKMGASVAAPVLTVFGLPVEQWTYVLSAVVSLFFIIEKFPMFLTRMRTFVKWVKTKYERKK